MKRAILITGGFLMLRHNETLGTIMIISGIAIVIIKELKKKKK